MKQFLRTILRILDGSPSYAMATQNRQRGQSMLELALITPLLAILVAGAVEVGWYTNRWLSLLEVTRVGARSATFLQGELSPLQWDNTASVHPDIQLNYNLIDPAEQSINEATNARFCETGSDYGFYSFIVCIMETSLDPLEIRTNEVDDIVVSVFAVQPVNNAIYSGTEPSLADPSESRPRYRSFPPHSEPVTPTEEIYKVTYDLNGAGGTGEDRAVNKIYPPGMQSIVVGRYPINANECTNAGDDIATTTILPGDPSYEPDPFNYLDSDANGVTSSQFASGEEWVLEVRDTEGNAFSDTGAEFQRGFSFMGQHRVDDPNVFCFGSEFTVAEVERLINMPDFIEPDLYDPPPTTPIDPYNDWVLDVYDSQDERMFFESQGITLVEIFWEHDLLLNFPLFRPLQEAYDDEMVIALWSAFPLPTVSPNITYQLP